MKSLSSLLSTFTYLTGVAAFGEQPVPLGGQFQVNAFTTDDQRNATVASDSEGEFVVVWESPGDARGYGIRGFLPDSGKDIIEGVRFNVNSGAFGDQLRPKVARELCGQFVGGHVRLVELGPGPIAQSAPEV